MTDTPNPKEDQNSSEAGKGHRAIPSGQPLKDKLSDAALSFFEARIRNQAENLVYAVFGYPATASIELEYYSALVERISAALLVAHASTQPEDGRQTTTEESPSPASQTESESANRSSVPLPSDVQKKIAEIRERRAKHTNYHRDPYQTVAQQGVDIDFLLSIIDTADNGYVRGLEEAAKVCDQHQTNMALHSEPALAEQSRQDAQVIRALISQQEVKEP